MAEVQDEHKEASPVSFARPCGSRILRRGWSRSIPVFVNEAVAAGRFHDSKVALARRCWYLAPEWWSLINGAVRAVAVVVLDVVDDESFELALVPDDGAV